MINFDHPPSSMCYWFLVFATIFLHHKLVITIILLLFYTISIYIYLTTCFPITVFISPSYTSICSSRFNFILQRAHSLEVHLVIASQIFFFFTIKWLFFLNDRLTDIFSWHSELSSGPYVYCREFCYHSNCYSFEIIHLFSLLLLSFLLSFIFCSRTLMCLHVDSSLFICLGFVAVPDFECPICLSVL